MKRLLLALAGLALLLVLVLALAPLLFGDAIESRVNAAIDRRVEADVSYDDVRLGLFRHFPNLAVSVDELAVTGVGDFDGDTLAYADRFRLVVDLGSAVRMLRRGDPLVVREVRVTRPYLHARVLEDGRASWDIAKAVDEATGDAPLPGSRNVRLSLRRLEVEDGRVAYEDAVSGIDASMTGVDHTLEGDFSRDRFDLRASTAADAVSLTLGGVPYLTGARVRAEAEIDADRAAGRYTLRENRFAVNELGVAFEGTVTGVDDGSLVDLSFEGDRAGLREILSLVPALYTESFRDLEADGTVAVRGSIQGQVGGGRVPAFGLTARVEDGRFRYADLPTTVTDVGLDVDVSQPAADLDSTVVRVDRLAFTLEGQPFLASLRVATPVSDPEIAVDADGRVDLAAAGRALELPGIDELRGEAEVDATVRARRSWVEERAYDRIEAAGHIALAEVEVRGEALRHPIAIEAFRVELSPRRAEVPVLRGRVGASDFQGSGLVDNLLGFALRDEPLTGRAEIRSRHVALDEWRREDPSSLRAVPVPANLDLALTADIDSMTFGDLVMTGARGDLRVRDRRVTLDRFGLTTLGGEVLLSGWYETLDPTPPSFDLQLGLVGIDIPGAAAALRTVRALAPAAAFATGELTADMALAGSVGADMNVALPSLSGAGGIRTLGLGVREMPVLDRLATALRVDRIRQPTVSDIAASLRIREGRVEVRPFGFRLGPAAMTVGGSHGIDGSLDYALEVQLPRELLGSEANAVITGLLEQGARAGLRLSDADAVRVEASLGGTFRDPAVSLDLAETLTAAGADLVDQARTRVQEEAARQAAEARARVEQARAQAEADARARLGAARIRARARADSILAAADTQADRIRAEAARAGERLRTEADRQAQRLVAEAGNPVARRAAEVAGDRLRSEADRRAVQLVQEAERRAQQVLDDAGQRADAVLAGPEAPADSPDADTTGADPTSADTIPPDTARPDTAGADSTAGIRGEPAQRGAAQQREDEDQPDDLGGADPAVNAAARPSPMP